MLAEAQPKKLGAIMPQHRGQQQLAASAGAVTGARVVVKVVDKIKLLLDSDGHPVFVRPVYKAA